LSLDIASQLPSPGLARVVGGAFLRDQDVDQASPLRPPVIWPITNEVAVTMVRDAK